MLRYRKNSLTLTALAGHLADDSTQIWRFNPQIKGQDILQEATLKKKLRARILGPDKITAVRLLLSD